MDGADCSDSPGRGLASSLRTNRRLNRTRFFTRILHSLTLLLYLNTVSERVRTESQYFRVVERTPDIAKRARIEFLVGTGFKQPMDGCGPCVFASPARLRVQG